MWLWTSPWQKYEGCVSVRPNGINANVDTVVVLEIYFVHTGEFQKMILTVFVIGN
jgi:hypothetical protein